MPQRIYLINENALPEGASHSTRTFDEFNENQIPATVANGRGQYILVRNINEVPQGATWRGHGWAEVEVGRGNYIQVANINEVPHGAAWRNHGYAEVGAA